MIYIDYLAEACGEEGGGVYFFNDGNSLIKAIQLLSVSDSGIYWHREKALFPKDAGGKEGKVVLVSEHGEVLDENSNFKKETKLSKEFISEGKELQLDRREE